MFPRYNRQLNRVLTENSRSGLSGPERRQIVEKMLGWCAHPEALNRENNPYNRVLKLSAKDYERSPAETIKKMADFALTADIVTSQGRSEFHNPDGRKEYMRADYDREKARSSDLMNSSLKDLRILFEHV